MCSVRWTANRPSSFLNPVDMVLLDYMMPGMDGGVVAREIKRRRPSIPVIIVSASPMADEMRTCVECILPTAPILPSELQRGHHPCRLSGN
jgi:CheY-like chemotaxis protein